MNITADIRAMLKEKGWTQDQLAKAAGVHPVTLSRFLNGKRGQTIIERLWPFVYEDEFPTADPVPKAYHDH